MRSTPFLTASLFVFSLTVSLPLCNQSSVAFSIANTQLESHVYPTSPTVEMAHPQQMASRRGIPKRREGGGTRYV